MTGNGKMTGTAGVTGPRSALDRSPDRHKEGFSEKEEYFALREREDGPRSRIRQKSIRIMGTGLKRKTVSRSAQVMTKLI
jgi:hypothetical protein